MKRVDFGSIVALCRLGFGALLLFLAAGYWQHYPGGAATGPTPRFTTALWISAGTTILAAVISQFAARSRAGVLCAVVAAGVGVLGVVGLLLPALLAPANAPPIGWETDRIGDALPWVLTTATAFVSLLPKEAVFDDETPEGDGIPREH